MEADVNPPRKQGGDAQVCSHISGSPVVPSPVPTVSPQSSPEPDDPSCGASTHTNANAVPAQRKNSPETLSGADEARKYRVRDMCEAFFRPRAKPQSCGVKSKKKEATRVIRTNKQRITWARAHYIVRPRTPYSSCALTNPTCSVTPLTPSVN